jgi:subtilase family serine protease
MKPLKWGLVGLGLAVAASGVGPAAAQSDTAARVQLELSGTTYHKAVCPHAARAGFARCFAHVVTDARGNIKTFQPHGKPNFGFTGYTATDLRNAYKITGSGSGTYTVAIVDAYGYPNAEADLAVYRQEMGLPPCTTANGCFKKVDQRGGTNYPATDTGWDQEQALDLDMVSAACPNCHILLVQGDSASIADLGAAVNQAAAMGAKAISNSYGLTESSSLAPYEAPYNHPGIAVTVSTGDSGYGVQFPANSSFVTAVGGTTLKTASNARGWTETAWSGAGSGCSSYVAKPSWQTDTLCSRRMVADVSAVADPNTGARVYGPTSSTASGWMIIGGTSLSAPFIAGVYGVNGGTATFGSDPYSHISSLFDVTSGNNGKQCKGTYFCTSGVGYDGPTGLGTPNGTTAF